MLMLNDVAGHLMYSLSEKDAWNCVHLTKIDNSSCTISTIIFIT